MTRVSYMNDSSQLYRLLVSTDTRRVFPVLLYLPATPTHHYLPPSFTYQSFFLFIILLSHLIHYDSKSLSKTWKHFEIEIQNTNLQFRIYILLKKPSWSSSCASGYQLVDDELLDISSVYVYEWAESFHSKIKLSFVKIIRKSLRISFFFSTFVPNIFI